MADNLLDYLPYKILCFKLRLLPLNCGYSFRSASDMTQKELMENCFMNLFCLNGYNGENSAFLGSLIFTS